jgi:hypothetical protein
MNQCFFVDSDASGNLLVVVARTEADAARWGVVDCRVPNSVARLMDINLDRCGAYVVDSIEAMQILVP